MNITVQELKMKMERGDSFVLIDVREPDEHQQFNIGGLLIPLGAVPASLPDLEEHQAKEVIVYCRSGRRSATAQYLMQRTGFKNVRNLEGGMLSWIENFGV